MAYIEIAPCGVAPEGKLTEDQAWQVVAGFASLFEKRAITPAAFIINPAIGGWEGLEALLNALPETDDQERTHMRQRAAHLAYLLSPRSSHRL